jgi:hypothetical protein
MHLQFALDKAAAAVYEGIAIATIEQWYYRQGFRINVRYNEQNGLEDKRGFDLVDSYGKKWEVKCDRASGKTGNIFLERFSLERSLADYFLIFACGLTYIFPREVILKLLSGPYKSVQGGDDYSAVGMLVPLEDLNPYVL